MADAVALHEAFIRGDLDSLRELFGRPASFPNVRDECGAWVLEYAIYHSPLSLVRQLLELGANLAYEDHAGFPSLIAAISADRSDKRELLELLLSFGADIEQRGINDFTPLHQAAVMDDVDSIEILLAHGADVNARTRIDEYATPLEEAEILGSRQAAAALRTHAQAARSLTNR